MSASVLSQRRWQNVTALGTRPGRDAAAGSCEMGSSTASSCVTLRITILPWFHRPRWWLCLAQLPGLGKGQGALIGWCLTALRAVEHGSSRKAIIKPWQTALLPCCGFFTKDIAACSAQGCWRDWGLQLHRGAGGSPCAHQQQRAPAAWLWAPAPQHPYCKWQVFGAAVICAGKSHLGSIVSMQLKCVLKMCQSLESKNWSEPTQGASA